MSDRLQSFYSRLYASEKHDSPELSRVSLARKVIKTLEFGIQGKEVLNIGSGPQALEKQIWNMGRRDLVDRFDFTTLDIAKIHPKKLLGKSLFNISHTQASALSLPYENSTFGLVVSNHAIDFLPSEAFGEARRVLDDGGKAIFYFHHPDMIPHDLREVRNEEVQKFWTYLRETNRLFDSSERIEHDMSVLGFNVDNVELNNDNTDKWWEVELSV